MNITPVFMWIGLMLCMAAGAAIAAALLGLACEYLYRKLQNAADLALLLKFFRRARRHGWLKTKAD